MLGLVEKLKEIGKYKIENFRHGTPTDDDARFLLRWTVTIPEMIMASHYFYNGQMGKGMVSIVIGEAVKYGLHKLLDEYLPQNQERFINFLEKYLGKKNPQQMLKQG